MTPIDDDGTSLLRAFEGLAARACAPDADAASVLEVAAMGIALAELGLIERAPDRDRVASRARKVLLSAAGLRSAAEDDDVRDALDLAIEQARRGAALLAGGSVASLDGAPTYEPTPSELAALVRGELDGHAAADVALRLHRSGVRDRYAAFLPHRAPERRIRLAADSAPVVRDPSMGRALGASRLGDVALEAFAFEDGGMVVSIYAEPAIGVSLVSSDAPLASRALETSGYLELHLGSAPLTLTLVLSDGDRSVTWTLSLQGR